MNREGSNQTVGIPDSKKSTEGDAVTYCGKPVGGLNGSKPVLTVPLRHKPSLDSFQSNLKTFLFPKY